jgi:hypothetical protein
LTRARRAACASAAPKENAMTDQPKNIQVEYWAKKFDDIDREIARLATMCNVRILDAGVIERVLHNDASVCGTQNKLAFDKMRSLLMMHYSVRESAVDVLGVDNTRELVETIVTSLREKLGERLGNVAPG